METKYHRLVRLILAGRYTNTEIAEQSGISRTTVIKWSSAIKQGYPTWDAYQGKSDKELRSLIFPNSGLKSSSLLEPNWEALRKEHRVDKIDKKLLYEEYVNVAPEGSKLMSLSRFYELFDGDVPKRGAEMLFKYLGGEQIQFDFVGGRPDFLIDQFGNPIRYEVGVAVSCASRFIFARAMRSQRTECSIQFICDMFESFGGVHARLIVDNFKAAILKARTSGNRAVINPRFQACADHFNIGISPARGGHPRDKGMGENSVLQVQRSILSPLRNRKFHSISEINEAFGPLLDKLNDRPMKTHGNVSRRALFESIERQELLALPNERYLDGEWFLSRTVRANLTFEADGNHYSVPEKYIHEKVDAKLSATTVFVYHDNQQIACHERQFAQGVVSFHKYHRPHSHQYAQETQLSSCIETVAFLGEPVVEFMKLYYRVNRHNPPPREAAWEIVQLAEEYGEEQIFRACQISNQTSSASIQKLQSIIKCHAEQDLAPKPEVEGNPKPSGNVRGEEYYKDVFRFRGGK